MQRGRGKTESGEESGEVRGRGEAEDGGWDTKKQEPGTASGF